MVNLLSKVVNCYQSYINYLNYGITNQNYEMLYNANLVLRNNITEEKFRQYFYNNLGCDSTITIQESSTVNNKRIYWTINSSPTLNENFTWNEIIVTENKTYNIITNSVVGFNYIYIATPQEDNFILLDEMNNILYDSASSGHFEYESSGMIETSQGNINIAYKKKNIYNSNNQVQLTLKFY